MKNSERQVEKRWSGRFFCRLALRGQKCYSVLNTLRPEMLTVCTPKIWWFNHRLHGGGGWGGEWILDWNISIFKHFRIHTDTQITFVLWSCNFRRIINSLKISGSESMEMRRKLKIWNHGVFKKGKRERKTVVSGHLSPVLHLPLPFPFHRWAPAHI